VITEVLRVQSDHRPARHLEGQGARIVVRDPSIAARQPLQSRPVMTLGRDPDGWSGSREARPLITKSRLAFLSTTRADRLMVTRLPNQAKVTSYL